MNLIRIGGGELVFGDTTPSGVGRGLGKVYVGCFKCDGEKNQSRTAFATPDSMFNQDLYPSYH